MPDPTIRLTGLRKAYGDLDAVHDVSLEVQRGEVFCLLGPNGAGKTTTVEIMEGYRLRSGGDVRVLGHDPAESGRELRERVGIVLQETGVQEQLTLTELLTMYGGWYARRRDPVELLALVGLEGKGDSRAKALSGGQRRRLDLALALVGDPELLFLDEPTTGFDPEARRQAWQTVRALAAQGTTIFLTTHFMDEAQALADRIAVMAGGRIVAEGTPDEIGGRDRAPAEIRFRLPAGLRAEDLPWPATEEPAGHALVRAQDVVARTHEVTGWALEHGHELVGLSVARPSLEDTYLQLTREVTTP